jgi:hypothetical protein
LKNLGMAKAVLGCAAAQGRRHLQAVVPFQSCEQSEPQLSVSVKMAGATTTDATTTDVECSASWLCRCRPRSVGELCECACNSCKSAEQDEHTQMWVIQDMQRGSGMERDLMCCGHHSVPRAKIKLTVRTVVKCLREHGCE